MRRDPLPLLLLLCLVLLGSLAWLTRDPDHPLLDRLAGLPGVGPAVERFRQAYRAPRQKGEPGSRTEVVIVAPEPAPGQRSAVASRPLGKVWVRGGTALRREPAGGSEVVATLRGLRTMTLLERRGEWRRVSRVDLSGRTDEGWVRVAELAEPTPEELWEPDPVLPLPAVAPEAELLAEARELMGEKARRLPCGPYRLLTDIFGPLVESCPRLAGQLDGLYAARTGLAPAGGPAEEILLFGSDGAYLIFRARRSPDVRRHAFAAPARGFVAVAAGGRPLAQVQATVVHELVHLLNRRHLGPALPPWLDEGLAEELAMSAIAPDGRLAPGSLGLWQVAAGSVLLQGGGGVLLDDLRERMRGGGLPRLDELVALESRGFQVEERFQLHYSLSAFWVRYLLGDEAPAAGGGFRAFLASVAAGEPLDEKLLLSRLGRGWDELERGFRDWLERGAPVGGAV